MTQQQLREEIEKIAADISNDGYNAAIADGDRAIESDEAELIPVSEVDAIMSKVQEYVDDLDKPIVLPSKLKSRKMEP